MENHGEPWRTVENRGEPWQNRGRTVAEPWQNRGEPWRTVGNRGMPYFTISTCVTSFIFIFQCVSHKNRLTSIFHLILIFFTQNSFENTDFHDFHIEIIKIMLNHNKTCVAHTFRSEHMFSYLICPCQPRITVLKHICSFSMPINQNSNQILISGPLARPDRPGLCLQKS